MDAADVKRNKNNRHIVRKASPWKPDQFDEAAACSNPSLHNDIGNALRRKHPRQPICGNKKRS